MINAKVICDSIGPAKVRLTTFVLKFPRYILAEFNTHRAFSRNAASSRAIPTKKFRERVTTEPVVPVFAGKNQPGMQATEEVEDVEGFKEWWSRGLEMNARHHAEGESKGYHKQITNRLLENWLYVEVVATADQFGIANLLKQRMHPDAQPEFRVLAEKMWEAYKASTPKELASGEWHLPYVTQDDVLEVNDEDLKKVSVGRCARVSYLNHEGTRSLKDDIALYERLVNQDPGHFSPLEHVAMACESAVPVANFSGWYQLRKRFKREFETELPNT